MRSSVNFSKNARAWLTQFCVKFRSISVCSAPCKHLSNAAFPIRLKSASKNWGLNSSPMGPNKYESLRRVSKLVIWYQSAKILWILVCGIAWLHGQQLAFYTSSSKPFWIFRLWRVPPHWILILQIPSAVSNFWVSMQYNQFFASDGCHLWFRIDINCWYPPNPPRVLKYDNHTEFFPA